VLVILNNTYTILEAEYALNYTGVWYFCSMIEVILLIKL
jgi:hypothetical protein